MSDPVDPRLALLRALNTPPYDLAAGKTGTALGEAARLLDDYRAAVLREAADVAYDEALRLYDDMGQKAAAGARLVGDLLRARADATQQAERRLEAVRCSSCEHEARYHDVDGRCWFTVEQGAPGRDSVCACLLRRLADEKAVASDG